jgi:hypothetical protein
MFFYDHFDEYDLITYPLRFGTDLVAADRVSVVRVSPEDAPSLIDERGGGDRRKLAGNRLGNFAAFVDELWRRNDMLWGRLDAAERLVGTLLPPGHPDRETLRDQALSAVLAEELSTTDRNELCRLLALAVWKTGNTPEERDLERLLQREFGQRANARVSAALRYALSQRALLDYFRTHYNVDRSTSSPRAMSAITRAIRIVGRMLEGTADRAGRGGGPFAWITRLGRVGWWFVEIATPGSLAQLEAGHLWALATLLALLLYGVGGGLLHNEVAGLIGRRSLLILGGAMLLWVGVKVLLASGVSVLRKLAIAAGVGLGLFGLWKLVTAFALAGRWLPPWARTGDFDLFLAAPMLILTAWVIVAMQRMTTKKR